MRHNPNFTYNIHPPPAPTKVPKNTAFPECIAAGQQNRIWGDIYSLKGQISSVHLFNDSLNQSVLSDMFLAGKFRGSLPKYQPLLIETANYVSRCYLISSLVTERLVKASERRKYPHTHTHEVTFMLY